MAKVPSDVAEELVFHQTDDRFYLEPVNSRQVLVIDRLNHDITLEDNVGQVPFGATRRTVYGLVGILHLVAGPCLVLVTRRTKVGVLNKHTIWRVQGTDLVLYARSTTHLTPEQRQYNEKYMSMVQQVLSTPYFYFSYTYDLTHTLQRLYYTAEDFLQMALHERADPRFVWNQHLMRDLSVQPEMSAFCLPIMHGFISIKQCSINGEWFTWSLISRRSVYRAGTRMWVRGIDQEGAVANFVETEQVVEFRDFRTSFVQTRGSIPLHWSQEPDLRFKPDRKIRKAGHEEAFNRHFEAQVLTYGRQVAVNLVNQKGKEGRLHEAFRNLIETSSLQMIRDNVRYEHFDFLHECRDGCRKMRWDRLSNLLDRLEPDREAMGYFLQREGVVLLEQEGVFRTNCSDSLDRTNLVQFMLARKPLQAALTRMGILSERQRIEDQLSFESVFCNVWADNGDVISTEYAGTGSLLTEVTRTGKLTRLGLLKVWWRMAIKYIKTNFADGDRQDSIDLFLGKYQVETGEGVTRPCPLKNQHGNRILLLPGAVFFSLLMVFACVLLPSEYTSFTLLSLLFWAAMMVSAAYATLLQGRQLVNAPRLATQSNTMATASA